MLIREKLMHLGHLVKLLTAIPVNACTPDIPGSPGIGQHGGGAFDHNIAVVVPDDDVYFRHSRFMQHRAQMVFDKIPLLLRTVHTGIPGLNGCRLILHRDCPDRNPLLAVGFNEFRVIPGPYIRVFRLQRTAIIHLAVGLHPSGGTPRGGQHCDRAAFDVHCVFNQRNHPLMVMGNIKGRQR
ncbi:hypothetical protein D3C75_759850 [compost metagenome]